MMNDRLVYDFDGTLVLENSTRVLEKVMFSRYRGRLRREIGWAFFGIGRRGINALSSIIGVLTRRRIDWRFLAFIRLMGGQSPDHLATMCEAAAARLTLNKRSIECLRPGTRITVASCGLAPVIDAFIMRFDLDADVVKASEISVTPSGRIQAKLLDPRVKSAALQAVAGLHFVTDDRAEARLVAADCEQRREGAVDVFESDGLYHVVDRTSTEERARWELSVSTVAAARGSTPTVWRPGRRSSSIPYWR